MPNIPHKTECKKEAQELAKAIDKILKSNKYQQLLDVFEAADPNLPADREKVKKILKDDIMIDDDILKKFMKGAFSGNSVSFNWF